MGEQPDAKGDVEAQVNQDRLDVAAIAAVERVLRLPTVEGWREFSIPSDLSIPVFARLLIIERKINEAEAESLEAVMNDALNEIMRVVRVRTPDAPAVDMDEFGIRRIGAAISWIAGDVSVAESLRSALTDGLPPAEPGAPVATAHAASEEGTGDGDSHGHGEDPGPLVSSELSSTPSSGSEESSGGNQSGGEPVAGPHSGSTSATPISV
jgi:hypothetical protein